jgi:hypothetical protein
VAGNSQTDRGRVLPDQPIQLVNEADLLGKEVGISQSAIAPAAKNSPVSMSIGPKNRLWKRAKLPLWRTSKPRNG